MPTNIPIALSESGHLQTGDFAVHVCPDKLEVPPEVWRVAGKFSLRDAAELVSYLYAFPTSFATELGWNLTQLQTARDRLAIQLKGIVADNVILPTEPVRRVYGAMPPVADTNKREASSGE